MIASVLAVLLLLQVPSASPRAPLAQPESSETYFRSAYDADTCNKRKQTWNEYWSWVHRFYTETGGGWQKLSETVASKVTDPAKRDAISAQLVTLGRRVAGEWAKDNSCRKIRTTTGIFNVTEAGKPALSTWADALQEAARQATAPGQQSRARS